MKITYYTNRKIEVLSIKDDDGNAIKDGIYSLGNCLIDILYGNAIIDQGHILQVNHRDKITGLLEKCDDYLHNDIKNTIENDMAFIFNEEFSYRNVFIENKLCRVYFFNDIQELVCLLLTNIYLNKLMYKRCAYCKRLFATRFSNARFCKRVATKSGKTCRYAYVLKMRRKHHTSSDI